MPEKIKTNAVLCALPDEWIRILPTFLRHKGIETMEAHTREEMLALLETHSFRGMVIVSSWLPENEVVWGTAPSIKDIPAIILVESQHQKFGRFTSIEVKSNHEWIYIPFDIEEVILRASTWMGLTKE